MPALAIAPIVLSLFACSAAAAAEPGAADPASASGASHAPLRFAWPVPGRVRITETAVKRGTSAIARYELLVTPAPGGGADVRYTAFEPLEVDGQPVGAEASPAVRAAFASLMPRFRIDANGRLSDVVGLDRLARLQAGPNTEPEAPPELTPATRAVLRAAVASTWAAWAGAWIELDLAPGAEVRRPSEVSLLGTRILQTETVRNLGPAADAACKVRLRSETELDDQVAGLVRRALDAARGPTTGSPPERAPASIDTVEGTATAEVLTDPATLMPTVATREKAIHVTFDDGREVTSVEKHRYEFEWIEEQPAP